jgi:hypothetical protein
MTPKKPRRWLTAAVAEAARCEVVMPWAKSAAHAPAADDRATTEPRAAAAARAPRHRG